MASQPFANNGMKVYFINPFATIIFRKLEGLLWILLLVSGTREFRYNAWFIYSSRWLGRQPLAQTSRTQLFQP